MKQQDKKRMSRFQGRGLAVAVLLTAAISPAFAHHGFDAEFTLTRPVTLTGVVTKVDWINPHAYFYLDVKDKSGKTVNWAFETQNPGQLHHNGMQRDMVPIGATVTIDAYGARIPNKPLAWITRIHFKDGRSIVISDPNADAKK